jgi:hypothetical protein
MNDEFFHLVKFLQRILKFFFNIKKEPLNLPTIKIINMVKNITIAYNEADESLLLALFSKFKIKVLSPPTEITVVRQRLHDKYVVNGTWETMDEEAREDAAHAETMLYAKEQPDYHVYSVADTKAHRAKLRQQLTAKLTPRANH